MAEDHLELASTFPLIFLLSFRRGARKWWGVEKTKNSLDKIAPEKRVDGRRLVGRLRRMDFDSWIWRDPFDKCEAHKSFFFGLYVKLRGHCAEAQTLNTTPKREK